MRQLPLYISTQDSPRKVYKQGTQVCSVSFTLVLNDFLIGANGSVLRRDGKACYPFLWQKQQPHNKKEPQLRKLQKPQKRLKLFCHTTTIRAILQGLNEYIQECKNILFTLK